ncbi:MAG: hypothetical protein LBV67_09215 [Streptococcaceae bacterium]|nr:hypothetical protein [Streptococcaceae bacterium]
MENVSKVLEKKRVQRAVNKKIIERNTALLMEYFSFDNESTPIRKRPRNPDEKRTLERWAKEGYDYGKI